LTFRMEQIDEGAIRSIWRETAAVHAEAESVTDMAPQQESQQQAAESSKEGESKPKPIRKSYANIGRNDPCPCKSNKKYKKCCLPRIQQGLPPLWDKSASVKP
ncbi:MAG: SEC-C metal-binding domain-containing protein, partial [Planctomycetales bacterium]